MAFYTSVKVYGNHLLYRGRDNAGNHVVKKIPYKPTIYLTSKSKKNITTTIDQQSYRTLFGKTVYPFAPGSIKDTKEFIEKYDGIADFPIYGNTQWEYVYIGNEFKGEIKYDRKQISVAIIDIEVSSENGFPDIKKADNEITAITVKLDERYHVFGCGEYVNISSSIHCTYYRCDSESDLLRKFLSLWKAHYPDIITGWNITGFDIPYLYNRIVNTLGEADAKKLSPWGIVFEREMEIGSRHFQTYTIFGIAILDYIVLYRKFSEKGQSQESYTLNYISSEELGLQKLSYAEYGNLHNLYKQNFQKFIDYNIRDVELVQKLDRRLGLIDLALILAYQSKVNYEDVFHQTRMWDALVYNHLNSKNIVIPKKERRIKDAAYVGAYVRDPIVGMHKWVVGYDLTSLYPSLILQYNISPETIVDQKDWPDEFKAMDRVSIHKFLYGTVDLRDSLTKYNLCVTPNHQFFRRDVKGLFPELIEEMMKKRKIYKELMLAAEKKNDAASAAMYHNMQWSIKICLNSLYGAYGNQYFRFYDVRCAEGITTAGQLVSQWISNKINEDLNNVLGTTDVDRVVAGDTDSCYITFSDFIPDVEKRPESIVTSLDILAKKQILPRMRKHFDTLAENTNAYRNAMEMKRETISEKGLWIAKKRYILTVWDKEGVRYDTPQIKVTGLEMIKSSTPGAVRAKMRETIDLIVTRNEADLQALVEDFEAKYPQLPIEDIASPRSVNGLDKYARGHDGSFANKTPVHVRGSLVYNEFVKEKHLPYPLIQEGEKIKFVYLTEPNPYSSYVIAFPDHPPEELELKKWVDYEKQLDHSFIQPLKIILDKIGWQPKKQDTLESLFA